MSPFVNTYVDDISAGDLIDDLQSLGFQRFQYPGRLYSHKSPDRSGGCSDRNLAGSLLHGPAEKHVRYGYSATGGSDSELFFKGQLHLRSGDKSCGRQRYNRK